MVTQEKLAYSIAEAAKALSISERLVYKEISRGGIRVVRFGGRVVIPRKVLDELLEGPE